MASTWLTWQTAQPYDESYGLHEAFGVALRCTLAALIHISTYLIKMTKLVKRLEIENSKGRSIHKNNTQLK